MIDIAISAPLPEKLTITNGQRIPALVSLQSPRMRKFIHENARHFRYDPFLDEEVYQGHDAVIP